MEILLFLGVPILTLMCLKVGSCSFEGFIILLIYFSKLLESTFYKKNKQVSVKSIGLKVLD